MKRVDRLLIGYLVLSIGVGSIFAVGMYQVETYTQAKQLTMTQEAVKGALMQYYAIEGEYPTDIQSVLKGYGVQIDETKYRVHYECFASNVMPKVKVLPRKE